MYLLYDIIIKCYVIVIVQARIQEFSSGGGVQLSENFDKQKQKEGEGIRVVALSPPVQEWFKSIFQTIICRTSLFSRGGGG